MAQIQIDISLNSAEALKGLKAITAGFKKLAESTNNIQVNTDLTKQIKAITANYRALAEVAQKVTRIDNQNQINTERLAAATAKREREEEKLKTAVVQRTAAEEKAVMAAERHKAVMDKLARSTSENTSETKDNISALKEQANAVDRLAGNFDVLQGALSLAGRLIGSAFDTMNEELAKAESQSIAINRMLDDSEKIDNKALSDKIYDLGIEYGQSFNNAAEAVSNFIRAGYSLNEALEAGEASLLALNVAELTAAQSSDGLISVMSQFKLETSDLTEVIDKLNKTADNYPVTTEKLLKALQRTGSTAKQANMSLDETIGVITALSKATNRSGENLGTAVNSLINYTSRSEALDLFAQLSDGAKKAVEEYRLTGKSFITVWQEISKALKSDQSIKDNVLSQMIEQTGELSQELHDELGDVFEKQEEIYGTANTYRKNYFVSLMEDMDTVIDASQTAADSAGYSLKENETEMESFNRKVQALETRWQKLATDEQGFLGIKKTLVDIGNALLTVAEHTGGLRTAFLLAGTAATLLFGPKLLTNIVNTAVAVGQTVKTTMKLPTAINDARKALQAAAQARAMLKTVQAAQTAGVASDTVVTEANTVAQEANAAARQAVAAAAGSALAWIGLGVTAISMISGAIEKHRQEQEAERQETIENWKAKQENAEKLQELKQRYESLTPKSEEFYQVEQEIVTLLGDKAKVLGLLTEKTDGYSAKVKELVEDEEKYYLFEREKAKKAATEGAYDALLGGEGSKFMDDIVAFSGEYPYSVPDYQTSGIYPGKGKSTRASFGIPIYPQDAESIIALGDKLQALIDARNAEYNELMNIVNRGIIEIGDETIEVDEEGKEKAKREADEIYDKIVAQEEFFNTFKEDYETLKGIQTDERKDFFGDDYVKVFEGADGVTKDLTNTLTELGKAADATNEQIDSIQNAISTLTAAQEEYAENGKISVDTLQSLMSLDSEYLQYLFDENGQLNLNNESLNNLIGAQKEQVRTLLAQQVATLTYQKAQELLAEQEGKTKTAAENTGAGVQASAIKFFEAIPGTLAYGIALDSVGASAGVVAQNLKLNEENTQKLINYAKNATKELRSVYANTDFSMDSGKKSGSSKSKSGSKKDEYLEKLKEAVSLRESELGLMEKQDASLDDRLKKIKEIQDALHTQAEYMRKNKGDQKEINKLSENWLKYKEDAIKLIKETYEDEQGLLDEQIKLNENQNGSNGDRLTMYKKIQASLHKQAEYMRSIGASEEEILKLSNKWWDIQEDISDVYEGIWEDLENIMDEQFESAEKAKDSALELLDKEREALEERKNSQEEQNTLLEKEKALKEAVIDLDNARKERNVRVYNEQTGMWEWEANAKNVKDATEQLENAKKALNDYNEEQKYQRALDAIDAKKEAINSAYDVLKEQWDYTSKALEKPVRNIIDVLNDISEYGTPAMKEEIDSINSLLGQFGSYIANASEASPAINQSTERFKRYYGPFASRNIAERMRINSGNWWNLEPAAKSGDAQAQLAQKKLHEENIALGRAVLGEFNPIDGKWYRNGKSLYDLPESQREYVSYDIVQPPNPYPVKKPENAPILNSSHDVLNALGITTPQNGTGITETYYKPLINEKEIVKNGGSVTNSNISTNSNNSYVINGVPIDTGMAETYTIRELLEVMPIVQNQF